MTIEAKIQERKNELIKVLSEDPTVDYKKIEKFTEGLITKDAKDGNGLEMTKWLYRHYTDLLVDDTEATPKRRGRKPGTKTKKTEAKAATKTETKAAGATPAKRRGRPKGSKNKEKSEKTE